jgi:hypothetical protein
MKSEPKKFSISGSLDNIDQPSVGLIVLNTTFTFERDFVRLFNTHKPN